MQVLPLKVQRVPCGIPPDCALPAPPRGFSKEERPGALPSGISGTEYGAGFCGIMFTKVV